MAAIVAAPVRCSPLRHGRDPRYPTRLTVNRDRTLLRRHLPAAWLRRRDVAALATALLAAGRLAGDDPPADETAGSISITASPVFTGGVIMPVPLHLEESEGRRILRDALAAAGLTDLTEDQALPDVAVVGAAFEAHYDCVLGEEGVHTVPVRVPVVADLHSAGRRVAVEYVADADMADLGGPNSPSYGGTGFWFGSAGDDQLRWAALRLTAAVRAQTDELYFRAFYDSVPQEVRDKQSHDEWHAAAEAALRAQVRDFIDYLKAQGVI